MGSIDHKVDSDLHGFFQKPETLRNVNYGVCVYIEALPWGHIIRCSNKSTQAWENFFSPRATLPHGNPSGGHIPVMCVARGKHGQSKKCKTINKTPKGVYNSILGNTFTFI